ncbi:hypothetical protein [Catenuloplanes indicus]|uniref:Uncharacterized protein n=1 Tax=Catenuloplanes indicus TaxID=137267 RepID=A0AAE4AV46_9ACTN|nr:hypothetical protein [Catenuloplanes indicus]MDQ0364500.1 hypothetical protein [Catenuloplanes indicus]
MNRLRALGALIVLATVAPLVPGTAAAAATPPLTVSITCDARTGAITTSTAGTLLKPGTPTAVTVEFARRSAYRITANGIVSLPQRAPAVVTATTNSAGEIAATGYTGTFDPVGSLFYREQVLVTYRNAATGASYTQRDATCFHDRRTTVALTCDPAAGTVTAVVTGVDGHLPGNDLPGRAGRVGYHVATISQTGPDDPRFRGESLGGTWDVWHGISRAADGTWSDTGYVHAGASRPYYYAEELTVGVFDAYGLMVGAGSARCVLFDGAA